MAALDLDDERDLDWPRRPAAGRVPGRRRAAAGFAACEGGASTRRSSACAGSIYHALPEELGTFDFVFCGSVLIHLRDQLLALERIGNLCCGTFISVESYDPWLNLLPFAVARCQADREEAVVFWEPNVRAWKGMLYDGRSSRIEQKGKFKLEGARGLVGAPRGAERAQVLKNSA